MDLESKYKPVLDLARDHVQDLKVEEERDVLKITGKATEENKQRLWDEYKKIDPNMRDGDIIINIESSNYDEVYEVQPGDSLSKIGEKYGVSWKTIYELNKETIDNPDVIFPGQKIQIPKKD
ncbi:LysM peptidoglycan-binding domain-containing protein [Mangrovivirga cuniculi]|uniref:Peptidoglycan-binding protein n=1 Tax=Mangrovivirga cuniculi TaxID=2715131 RepID=A0A4D7JX61_9BACT|nr:LysM domain-containing protein [Mangrovivirga cuniculi]QCK16726.1 peptidoglycan-binding protein [Mangrovivirga cuniculi]